MKKIAFLLSSLIIFVSVSFAQNCTDPCANNTGDSLPCTYDPDYNVCDDNCSLTTDIYDENTCACVYTPNVDDGCDLTEDSFDAANCEHIHEPIGCPPPNVFDEANCECFCLLPGCNNPCAINYDDSATCDDGSCVYPSPDDGCELTDDFYDAVNCVVVNTPNCPSYSEFDIESCNCIFDCGIGCSNPCAINYYPGATTDECCIYPSPDDGCDVTDDVYDTVNCTVINTPNCPAGSEFDLVSCSCITDCGLPPFCTAPCALNYNPNALCDDGSCTYPSPDDGCEYTDDSYDTVNCVVVNAPNCPSGTVYEASDCSCTSISTESIPTLSEWGLILLALILLNLGVLYMRQTAMEVV